MSLSGLFQTGRRSLRVLEGAIQTAGQNIANASTPGYSRQRVNLRADSVSGVGVYMGSSPGMFTGSGVSIASYERLRDGLLDRAANDTRADLGAAEEEVRAGRTLESALATGTAGSLTESVASFLDAWGEAANAPTDRSIRGVLLERVDTLSAAFGQHDDAITRLTGETRTSLDDGVDQFNALAEQVAQLNERVAASRAAGAPDFAAEDDRDQAIAALAAFAPIRTAAEDNGTVTVTVQGMSIVEGTSATGLTRVGPPDVAEDGVRFAGTDVAFKAGEEGNGRLGGWLRTLNDHLPETRAGLDALAARLVDGVNTAHAAGFGLDGGTGRDVFDPAGTTAATIARSTDLDDPDKLALAGTADAPGDVTVALAVADLRPGLEKDAAAVVGRVGQRVQSATGRADAAGALVDHFEGLADGVSGVSLDEEMTHLIEYQQAYAASARVLTTAQNLFDTLLAL